MTLTETLTILALLIAPLLAVQVQKWLEVYREQRERRLSIFKTLMASRAAGLSLEHVRALNMIDLEFSSKQFRAVTIAWKTYLDHLGSYPKDDEKQQPIWANRSADLLTTLLLAMGATLGYEFDEVHIKKAIYLPEAHGRIEEENLLIRRELLRLLLGNAALKMDVTSFPVSEQDLAEQKALRDKLHNLLEGKQALRVAVLPQEKTTLPQKDDPGNRQDPS